MVFSSCDSKAVGFDGDENFVYQIILHFPCLKSLLDVETRYDIFVGTGARCSGSLGKGDESSLYHHYIVLCSPKLSTRKNSLIFELGKSVPADTKGRKMVIPSVREPQDSGSDWLFEIRNAVLYMFTKITCDITLRCAHILLLFNSWVN